MCILHARYEQINTATLIALEQPLCTMPLRRPRRPSRRNHGLVIVSVTSSRLGSNLVPLTEAHLDGEVFGSVLRRRILRRDPKVIDDRNLEEVHLTSTHQHAMSRSRLVDATPTFGVITSIVLVLTSIQSLLSNVKGSLAIMITFSRLSALVILYRPPSWYSSNEVPEEKKSEDASEVRDDMYLGNESAPTMPIQGPKTRFVTHRVATTVSPSLTT